MSKHISKSEHKEVKIQGGRTIPNPSNTLKPKVVIKPKDKK